jgi:flagellar hook assembly protein FlgD
MKFAGKIIYTLIVLFCISMSLDIIVQANEISISPKISKFNTEALFDEKKEFDSQELIIKFKASVSVLEKEKILNTFNVKEISNLNMGGFSLVSVPKDTDLKELANVLLTNTQIEFVEPNYEVKSTYVPNDPGFSMQWHLNKIQSPKAWDTTRGATNISVAVIDGGVQTNHPDLTGKIINPYNAVTGGTTFISDDHATHVAGIIAATMNQVGVAGIAPNVKIMPINVFSGEAASTSDVVKGIYYAANNQADVINMSLGSGYYSYAEEAAVNYAKSKGSIIIAAAGNDDTDEPMYPAALPSVIGVSATDNNDLITWFSNYGSYIDFSAPGESIYSTITGSSYQSMSGTSMASPVVSGVAALILSKNPLLTPAQVEDIMKRSSVDLGNLGWDNYYGYGRVDAYEALQIAPQPATLTTPASFTMTGLNKHTISVTAQSGTKVTLYIQNASGSTIKELVTNQTSTGSAINVSWDGKQANGTYVLDGTYKVVAKVTNGRETIYKTSSIKVINNTGITIQLGATTAFSPTVISKVTIPYSINKNAKVTAMIYDKNNILIKTILNNSAVSVGSRTITWDGRNNSGQLVVDGTYKLAMSAVDYSNIKATPKYMAITVDTRKPEGTITPSSLLLKMNGTLKNEANFVVKEKVNATAYVTNDKGVVVKKFYTNKLLYAGTSLLSWDGKNDSNQLVPEGKYQYVVEINDMVGNKLIAKSSLITVQDWRTPVISATSTIDYYSLGTKSYNYSINKPGKVSIKFYQNGQVVKTIQQSIQKPAGTHTFTWDGYDDSGKILTDGKYSFDITIVDVYQVSRTMTGTLNVLVSEVEIQYPSLVQYHDNQNVVSEVYYKLSQPAKVTIEIYNRDYKKIRTIMTNADLTAGINYFNWDGLEDNGYDSFYDFFYYVITAKNAAGNETMVKGRIAKDEDPAWLISNQVSFTPSDSYSWYNKQLNLGIYVNTPIKAHLNVYLSEYDSIPFAIVDYNLVKGLNVYTYNKPTVDPLYYSLILQDGLGNKHIIEIDEWDY